MIMPNLTKFTWTDGTSDEISLTKIDDNFTAKYGRQKADLKELSIGEEVRSIESNAFKMCKNLEKVSMSPSVEKISVFAFAWCEKLRRDRSAGRAGDHQHLSLHLLHQSEKNQDSGQCHPHR